MSSKAASPAAVRSSWQTQTRRLMEKNWSIQKRKPALTAAEYFVVVCYLLFYYKLIYVIFPDDRPSPTQIVQLENDLNAAVPNSCTYLAMDKVAFIPNNALGFSSYESLVAACGVTNATAASKPQLFFTSEAAFMSKFQAEPMNYFAGVSFQAPTSNASSAFTILYNETLNSGRYVPNVDSLGNTLTPAFTFVPNLSSRGVAMNFGENRLADLQYRVQNVLSGGGQHVIKTASFPFQRAQCDGAGCVIKYMIPQLVSFMYMITLQSMLTSLGSEKEKGIKESLLLSGMSQTAYFGSWFLSKLLDSVPATVVWTVGAYALQCIRYQEFLPVLGVTFLYALQTLGFGLFVSTLFKKQKSMFMGCMVILMLSSLLYYPVRLLGIDKGMSTGLTQLLFLLPAVPISHFYWELADAEGVQAALDYSNPLLQASVYMQLVSFFFWMLLFAYLEQVLPQAHGPAFQKPGFLFDKQWWDGSLEAEAVAEPKALETEEGAFLGVEVEELVKEFPKSKSKDEDKSKGKGQQEEEEGVFRAVDGLTCRFPRGQITAVLGHNGAGKTTSIRCMTGGLAPSSGRIRVDGRDVQEHLGWLRRHVGVCPQHDVLYPELTAREHVLLFGTMKGDVDVERALGGVDMLGKADELVRSFSGGQKRRLSVALALLGQPAVVVLDEPTTGMDVITRQSVWKSIQRLRGRCTIILTTHAMEEADALGDQVVVLSRGKVQAQGSSLELKNRFGVGYHLHLVKAAAAAQGEGEGEAPPPFSAAPLLALLRSHLTDFDSVSLLTDVGQECSFALPREPDKFPALFRELEARREELGVQQVALSMTTLEEVFLQLGKREEEEDRRLKEEEERQQREQEEGKGEGKGEVKEEEVVVSPPSAPLSAPVVAAGGGVGSWGGRVKGGALLNLYTKQRNPMTSCALCMNPVIMTAIAGIIHLATRGGAPLPLAVLPFPAPPAAFPAALSNCSGGGVGGQGDWLLGNVSALLPSRRVDYVSLPALLTDLAGGHGRLDYELAVGATCGGGGSGAPSVTLYLNDSVSSDRRLLRQAVAVVQSSFTPQRLSTPTYVQLPKGPTAVINSGEWGLGGIMVLAAMPITFMSAYWGESLVRDRVGGNRVHLFVSSLKRTQYYTGAMLVDVLSFLPVALLVPLLLLAFQFEGAALTTAWAFILLFLAFAPAAIFFGYLLSWLFNSLEVAQEWFGELLNFSLAIPFLITAFVVTNASELAHSLCGVVPGYAIYRGLSVVEGEAKGGRPYATLGDVLDPSRSLLWVILTLLADALLFGALVYLAEMLEARWGTIKDRMAVSSAKGSAKGSATIPIDSSAEVNDGRQPDARVLAEEAALEAGAEGGASFPLHIQRLSKTFVMNDGRLNPAVRGVSLGVPKDSVFGLLGMNGAGKTTLLHSIQGKVQPSDGDCTIMGHSCVREVDAVRQHMGICPQHDVLWEYVTPREHLRAFAFIRGIEGGQVEATVAALLERLDLQDKADEPAGTLSGGMKRRLSIALAVVGAPSVVFLDEPTTGLDPNTRRFVWNYILELQKGRTVVLTTHSMEEADALCGRIGIMVNGKLMSLGTPQQLKGDYGAGYRLLVRLQKEAPLEAAAALEEVLRGSYGERLEAVPTASSATLRVFNIRQNDISLGDLFGAMEEQREALHMLDYSVSQTTMEQVFTRFAQFQSQEL